MIRVIGLMSGTSLDGVDVCMVRFSQAGRLRFEIEAFETYPLPEALKAAVLAQMRPETSRVDALCALDAELGAFFADAALRLIAEAGLSPEAVDLIGSHGQTIYHLPHGPYPSTMQLGDGSFIAVRTGITTVSDFRMADMAAGGQGAPLVPHADRTLFADPARAIALLNLGGIANITLMAPGGDRLLAFDTGPANMVVDRFVERLTEGRQHYDADGRIALSGRVQPELLDQWLQHPFFMARPPKSTGREDFGHAYADARYDEGLEAGVSGPDLVATATALTAHSVAQSLRAFAPPSLRPSEILVSGGGARNPALMAFLQEALAPVPVVPLDARGVSGDAKEALAFALFAYQAVQGLFNHAPDATGASTPLVLGKIAPGRNFAGVKLRATSSPEVGTESPNPLSQDLDLMTIPEILAVMNQEDARCLDAIASALPTLSALVARVQAALESGGRLFYVGAGTSGRLGVLDASECPPTFSTDPELVQGLIAGGDYALRNAVEGAEDDREAGAKDLAARGLNAKDVVVGIAASGHTPYVHGALAYAHELEAATGLIACNRLAERPAYVDELVELVVGPEILAGSTRLKAGTVTKLALNMISTAAMVRLGKVYGNRMVDVRVSNAKLARRALGMVQALGGVEAAEAERLLEASQGRVKTAIAMARCGLDAAEAERRLAEAAGRLRQVVGNPTP
ncbi:anhydro-N-acetylmuramic acid kinase [bacterium]|nr:anhydro-N-acetylmuramic acid kinase [bacterium]